MENEKILDLEMRLAFQEKTIQELNDVITDQQRQLSDMQVQLKYLSRKIDSLKDQAVLEPMQEPPPPHY